jgi:UDP-2,3-diacylglucosamine hydrolase
MPKTLFISDLHLAESHPRTTDAFLRFMRDVAPSADALYILGDLFEYWIGDDSLDHPFHRTIIDVLASIAANGTALFIMHGNRDFLLGQAFCDACHGTLLADPTLIDLYRTPTLLMHGDTLCTDDTEYIRFRSMVRDQSWQAHFLAKTLQERQAIVLELRGKSEEATKAKSMEITDVSTTAVEATLQGFGYPRLIHGHTHRPATHIHWVDGHACQRWVLTDWYGDRGGYLEVTPDGWSSHSLA